MLLPTRNIISGNNGNGVDMNGVASSENLIQGNFIGTDVNGTTALPNGKRGVEMERAPNNIVGGTTLSARNVISGNIQNGVLISRPTATGNVVQGNYIGTDVTGTVDLGNRFSGVSIDLGASNNTIGGTTAGARNLISGNDDGVVIAGSGTTGNQILGNFIGTDVNGTADLGNPSDGVIIENGASNNTIGGTASGAGNTIAFNGGDGVAVFSGTGNDILSNSIFSNTGLGIDLGPNGVTPDDVGDADTGANNLQNFPVLASATSGSITITGTLNSIANTTFRIEFFSNNACDPSGNGEGKTFLGFTDVTTDASGDPGGSVSFSAALTATVSPGSFITATATDPNNNTSEFSLCLQVVAAVADLVVTKTVDKALPNEGDTVTYTVAVTNDGPDAASGIVVTDLLPSGVSFVAASPSGTTTYSSGTGLWTVGSLAKTAKATLTITATVDSGAGGTTITNTASLTASEPTDANTGNNSASAALTVNDVTQTAGPTSEGVDDGGVDDGDDDDGDDGDGAATDAGGGTNGGVVTGGGAVTGAPPEASLTVTPQGPASVLAPQTPAAALAPLIANLNVLRVWHFDPSKQDAGPTFGWSFYDTRPVFADFNTLTEMVEGEFYWILVFERQTVVLGGKSRTLFAGWNPVTW